MLKRLILSVFLVGSFTFYNAQKIDATSKKILDAVTQSYNKESNSYFEFVFGSGTNGKVNKKEKGNFLSQGDKYILNVMGVKQIFDGNKIYNINEEDQEITIAKPDKNEVVFSPISYLKNYRKDFNVKHFGKKNILGKDTDIIKLTPIKQNGIAYVYLYVDTANHELLKLEQYGTNKDLAIIVMTKHLTNQKLDNNSFNFDKKKYKDFLITEL